MTGDMETLVERLNSLARDFTPRPDNQPVQGGRVASVSTEAASAIQALIARNAALEKAAEGDAWTSFYKAMFDAEYDLREASEARAKELEKALEPFGKYLDTMPFDLDFKGNPLPDDAGPGWTYLTAGDFRAARAALLNVKDSTPLATTPKT